MENWKFAIKSIWGHKMRSLLTMLGIIIGVTSVVVIMAMGTGMQKSVTDSFGADQKEVQVSFSAMPADPEEWEDFDYSTMMVEPELREEWLTGLLEVDGVKNYYTTLDNTTSVSSGKKEAKNVSVKGVSFSYFDVKKFKILAGRQISQKDYTKFSRMIMIDETLANKFFATPKEALNQTISVGEYSYLIIGVFKDPNAGTSEYAMNTEGSAIVTQAQMEAEMASYGGSHPMLYIEVEDVKLASEIGNSAASYLTEVSGVEPQGGRYEIYDISAAIDEINKVFRTITLVIGAIAGISLLVGGIGVMNIMLVSVTERTREIGLRKALGATRGNILSQFLIESVVLTLLGGLIGLALAYGLCALFNQIKVMDITAVISIPVVITSIIFSAAVGIVFGVLPANKASKLNPIEALRYE